MSGGKKNVLLVEDQSLTSELLLRYLYSDPLFNVVGKVVASSLAEVYCLKGNLDLILMDVLTQGRVNGIDEAKKLKERFPETKIIIITSMPEASYLDRAKQAHCDGLWYKKDDEEEFLALIRKVLSGEKAFPSSTPRIKLGVSYSDELTPREVEVLRLVTGGYTNEEIAAKLMISVNTVRNHVASLLLKTGFRNRIEMAVRARESGLVILDEDEEAF
jgi:DNA-binding NarL/FixJ family response regulator